MGKSGTCLVHADVEMKMPGLKRKPGNVGPTGDGDPSSRLVTDRRTFAFLSLQPVNRFGGLLKLLRSCNKEVGRRGHMQLSRHAVLS
jgi:hypothetical protein